MLNFDEFISSLPLEDLSIRLRLFSLDDIDGEYVSWLNDPEIVKFSNQRFVEHTFFSCRSYYNSFVETTNFFLVIMNKENNQRIGTMTIYRNTHHSTADIGIMIGNKKYWGRGVGKKAWALVLAFLLEKDQVRKITAGTLSCNIGMLNIMKSCGMTMDGVRKAQELVDGEPHDIIYAAKYT